MTERDLFPQLCTLERRAYMALPLQGRILLRCNPSVTSIEQVHALQYEGIVARRTDIRQAYDVILGRL